VSGFKTAMQTLLPYLRLLMRCIFVLALAASGSLRRARRRLCESGATIILTFHRVLDDTSYQETNSLPGIVIRLSTFREMVGYLSRHCELIGLADAVSSSKSERVRIVCTFDDGWIDNYTTAFPVVRNFNLPITIFICPDLMGQNMPFWPERAVALLRQNSRYNPSQIEEEVEKLKNLTPEQRERAIEGFAHADNSSTVKSSSVDRTFSWAEVLEMNRAGVCFGSHTNTHQILTTIPEDQCREELFRSKQVLEQVLAKPCSTFAYPNGNWSPRIRQAVAEAGFTVAVTTERRACTSASDPLTLFRVNVCESNVVGLTGRFSPAMFQYTTLWKAWRTAARERRFTANVLGGRQESAQRAARARESYSAPAH
jgi:peptidoglycan/xylan/chitin deacetylase (PgdA/CDA1 family)